MMQTASGDQIQLSLETLLRQTVDNLAALNAEALERCVELLTLADRGEMVELALPQSRIQWQCAELQHEVLGLLLQGTGKQLSVLRRVSAPSDRFSRYGAGSENKVNTDYARRRRAATQSATR